MVGKRKDLKEKKPDLWQPFLEISKGFNVTYHWVKGHAGHIENERCDELAVSAALSSNLKVDSFFESNRA